MYTSVLFSAAGVVPTPEPVAAPVSADRIDAFESAMQRRVDEAAAGGAPEATAVSGADAPAPTPQAGGIDADAEARARQGLGIDGGSASVGAAQPPSAGDMILNGIEKMRGVFDAREARIGELMSGKTLDANALMAMQMEVVNFTMLVDISSKLTGKSTQAFDTLMKG
ncbi:type III secretion system inner rod subunit SctI [Antarcticirhabdus aurantiaca]|uniref:Type III secretion system inner rod subunit SctI n=1 Tax=Antarcticirhabdus aurantiaca TaxID=2606717 RepID=A0ACD4NUZ0_9HYPH|nr:type III secretion system inner rod subunit SctI [Antarcticirhabdus aurantiaca]WAJ30515.1 type III secretion system inner rod subunit SctI [Jeongeuplla avenae]